MLVLGPDVVQLRRIHVGSLLYGGFVDGDTYVLFLRILQYYLLYIIVLGTATTYGDSTATHLRGAVRITVQ